MVKEITIEQVLKVYSSMLMGKLSRQKASEWGHTKCELVEDNREKITPHSDEDLIWELINYLHGIDMQSPDDRHDYILTNKNIIGFLQSKGLTIPD